jgi:lipoprotein signal peptidase
MMKEIVLFGGSFALVFALSFQQHHVHCRRYGFTFVNAVIIGALNLVMIKLGSQASPTEMLAYISGGPIGNVVAMWVHDKVFSEKSIHPASNKAAKA